MVNDTNERARAQEDDYFRRRDLELVEKIRKAAAAKATQEALGQTTGITDPETLTELQSLGFSPETINLLPLVPVLQVAWAEGGITPAERDQLLKLASGRGITEGSPAHVLLLEWMTARPAEAVFTGAGRLINALLSSGAQAVADLSADDLVKYCESIAAASGGVFGVFGRVSTEEKQLLASIAADLTGRRR
jgi:hypothetical protein